MIVVLGAGYAGLMVANSLGRKAGEPVVLVNERDTFVERVRLHQLAAGQELVHRPLSALVRGADLVVGRVVALDPAARAVGLADGREIAYDTLVYALGSRGDLSTPGAAEHAFDVGAPSGAVRLRDRLTDGGTVAVVGGGLTGIETAAELAGPAVKVVLVADRVGPGLSAKGRGHVDRAFARMGVEVRENALVTRVLADGVELATGDRIAADAVAWTAGFTVPALARDAGIEVDAAGRMVVDDTLRSVSHPDVYGVGDAAAPRLPHGVEMRMACATGLPAAQHAARAILARLAGREPRGLRFRYLNQCVSLGREDALIQFVHRDDSPKERILTGRAAVAYKEAIVRGVVVAERHPWIPMSL